MTIKVDGMDDVFNELEKLYGASAQNELRQKAVRKGGNFMVGKMKNAMSGFADTGRTVHETNLWGPNNITGFTNAKINWDGPMERYRLVHLNEFGHYDRVGQSKGNFINPRGKGVIDRTIQQNRNEYFEIVKNEVEKGV